MPADAYSYCGKIESVHSRLSSCRAVWVQPSAPVLPMQRKRPLGEDEEEIDDDVAERLNALKRGKA